MPSANPNGKTPKLSMPENLHFEREPLRCKRCRRVFEHFVVEKIDNLAQLRVGDVLISWAEMTCLHCGGRLYWKVNDDKLEEMSIMYGAIVKRLYSAE